MAKREYSEYQKRLIKHYYENRDSIAVQSLGEVVSEIYLTEPGVKRKRLWDRAITHLVALGVKESTWRPIVEADSPVRLAKLLTELHGRS
jgi:hypothetical protein